MIKIDSIKINNYKNIKSANFNLNNFNVIVGPNNAGKSNFIQIISFLNFIINGAQGDVQDSFDKGYFLNNFGSILPRNSKTVDIEIELGFSNTLLKTKYTYKIILVSENDKKINNKLRIEKEELTYKQASVPGKQITIFSRKGEKINFGSSYSKSKVMIIDTIPYFASVIRILGIISEDNEPSNNAINSLNSLLKVPIFYFSKTELNKFSSENRINIIGGRVIAFDLEKEIDELLNSSKKEIFTSIINKVLNINKIDPFHFKTRKEDKKMKNVLIFLTHLNNHKHISELSDGSKLLFALITKILISKESIFLIEEPENSIHPKALVELLRFIRSFSEEKQFIIVTHSITIINSVSPDDVIIAQIDKYGNSDFIRVSDMKDLKKQLRLGYVDFSEKIFFETDNGDVFEEVTVNG